MQHYKREKARHFSETKGASYVCEILFAAGPNLADANSKRSDRPVGSFELNVLASIKHNRDKSWGSNLRNYLNRILGRDVAYGQLYLALSRLEKDGFITTEQLDPEPIRGGRSKKLFKLQSSGERALDRVAALLSTPDAL